MNVLSKYFRIQHRLLLILGTVLVLVGTVVKVKADSRDILAPYQEEIQSNLPPGMEMRLPSQVLVRNLANGEAGKYLVRVFSFTEPKSIVVSLFSCDTGSPSCLVGSFSADSNSSINAQQSLKQHQAAAAPITLVEGVRGYLLEGALQNPPNPVSSVMWEQDNQIYTLRFVGEERRNVLYMAYSMANSKPIRGDVVGGVNQSVSVANNSLLSVTGGNSQVITGGNSQVITGGNREVVTGGNSQVITGGNREVVTGGNREVVTGGNRQVVTGGNRQVVTGGNRQVVTGGNRQVPVFESSSQFLVSGVEGGAVSSVSGGNSGNLSLERGMGEGHKPGDIRMGEGTFSTAQSTGQNSNSTPENRGDINESVQVETYSCAVPTESDLPPKDIPIDISGVSFMNKPLQIKITGSSVLDSALVNAAIIPIRQHIQGRNLSPDELRKLRENLAKIINDLYLTENYITSQVNQELLFQQKLLAQITEDGVVEIPVIEGRLQEINVQVKGTKRLNQSYVCSRILRGVSVPLNTNKLEDQLRLLRSDSHLDFVDAKLRATGKPGEKGEPGQSNLIVVITEASPFEVNLSADNYSPPSVGSERVGIGFLYRNLTGLGDDFAGSYRFSTTGGVELFDASYRVPINGMDGAIILRTSLNRNEITDSKFEKLGIRGNTELYEFFYRQPLIRNYREELALSLGFTFQEGQTFIFDNEPSPFGEGPDENGFSRTSVFKLGQDYVRRDSRGAWSLRSLFNMGTNLFDATVNPESIPDGQFFSWLGQVQRVEQLSRNNLLVIQGDLQLARDGLLGSQQFVIGGGESVRGYRQNARSGDNGFRFSIEDRIILDRDREGKTTLELVPFLDMGAVWNMSDNPNPISSERFLLGTGVGIQWNLDDLSLNLNYGIPLIDLGDRGDNLQERGFYFRVNYRVLD